MLSSPSLDLTPQQRMLPTAALVAYAALLALPGAELEQAVSAEISDNPALVMDEVPASRTAARLLGCPCDGLGAYCSRARGGLPMMAAPGAP